jgi:hypothetical protein
MKHRNIRWVVISFILSLILNSCSQSSNSSNCDIKGDCYYKNAPEILFDYVKENDYCSRYTLYCGLDEDKYGKKIWEATSYVELTKEEYEEMRKYRDIFDYTSANPGKPNFILIKK